MLSVVAYDKPGVSGIIIKENGENKFEFMDQFDHKELLHISYQGQF